LRDDLVDAVKSMNETLAENKQKIEIVYQEVCHVKRQLLEITNFIQAQQLDFQQKSRALL
ncbi:24684_t:CDS:2, partial [Racocetra persica]